MTQIALPKNTTDETGRRYGRLTVLDYAGRESSTSKGRGNYALWRCQCECGTVAVVRGKRLREGRTLSCGCYRRDPAVRQAAFLTVPAAKRRRISRAGILARASRK